MQKEKKQKKTVLAYSGGLDTSVAIKWLLENYTEEVIAVAVDLGQNENLELIKEKALKVGASDSFLVDAKTEFIRDFIFSGIKANLKYEFEYPLSTALARPLISKVISQIAKETQADSLAHGCTAKGNDQVRFELSWYALNPSLKVIAPAREWGELKNRKKAIEYAQKNKIPIEVTKKSPYSIDQNLWGRSVECGPLEDPWLEPPEEAFSWTNSLKNAPEEPEYLELEFQAGIPTKLNNQDLSKQPEKLIQELNQIAGKHSIGRIDQVENRLIGIKSREIYEAPAAVVLNKAHRELEFLVNTKDLMHFKQIVDQRYAQLVYDGLWFSPLRRALESFIESSQLRVSGLVKLKLYKSSCTVVGRKSTKSLYDKSLASYDQEDQFEHSYAEGFINLFGLDLKNYYKT